MKLNLTEKQLQELEPYFTSSEVSVQTSDLLNAYLDDYYLSVNPETMKAAMETSDTENDAFRALVLHAVGIEEDSDDSDILEECCHFPDVTKLDARKYINNPYYKKIHFHDEVIGNWKLSHNHFAAYEGFTYNDTIASEKNHYGEITPIGYFTEKVNYPIVEEKDVVWMSVTPHEIETMEEPIAEAKGSVITFGLGLGYYAYMVHLKNEVSDVTIIEKDPKVISLFKKYVLPQFDHPEKIHIIQYDAFKYIEREMELIHYDYAFVDIYHDAKEALPLYFRFRNLEKRVPDTTFSYWIEKTILCYMRRYVIILMEESLEEYDYSDYKNPQNEEGKILLKLFKALQDKEIHSVKEALTLLSDESLKELASIVR